jgi:uncharacterized membrane protein HdeD (DUF308 family)
MSQETQNIETQFMEDVKKNSGLTMVIGGILLLLGLFAMGSPLVAGLSVALMVGCMLILGGIGQLAFAVKTKEGVFAIIFGGLTIVIGGYMVANPGVALASFTLFLAIYLIISGIFEALISFQVRPVNGWGWALFSGVISVLLGLMIWNQFPLSGVWAIGVLIGVRLFFRGWTLVMFGFAARSLAEIR